MKALIDGDIIVYSAGFSSETREYKVCYNRTGVWYSFKYKKDAVAFCEAEDIFVAFIEKHIDPGPVSHALHSVKQAVRGVLRATKCEEYQIYLTGEGNFRETVAVTAKYKGNRDATHKPYHFEAIRAYLIREWGAIMVEGYEADDAMGMAQTDETIICSIDKDMDTVPGYHYNRNRAVAGDSDSTYYLSVDEARSFLYTQMLTGDGVDNIKGIRLIGPVKSAKLLGGKTILEQEQVLIEQYRKEFGERWAKRFVENFRLLRICTDRKQLPKGVR